MKLKLKLYSYPATTREMPKPQERHGSQWLVAVWDEDVPRTDDPDWNVILDELIAALEDTGGPYDIVIEVRVDDDQRTIKNGELK